MAVALPPQGRQYNCQPNRVSRDNVLWRGRQHYRHRLSVRRVGQHHGGGATERPRFAVNDVHRALRVGMLVIQRVRNELVLTRQDAYRRFQRADAANA